MFYMPSQKFAIEPQTDCMVIVPAPVVRLPDSYMYADMTLGYRLPPLQ